MNKKTLACISIFMLSGAAHAQPGSTTNLGPAQGDKEFSLSGTGSGDRNFDSASFGVSGDYGWYTGPRTSVGLRQSVNYASIENASITNDFWNGSTRLYGNYHFGTTALRPFIGGSIGGIYGDGVNSSAFAGLELGAKYYVLSKTFLLARAEYQWFFDRGSDINNSFDQGAWAYTVGIGYNF
ncbi:MAG: hypothetical protein WD071_13825 [Pseudohongiella sp.]|uniref:hypothetical protein n=1 Tax=Pseudohongiella sp. TaxID=1979412 RepID=UPI0034A09FC5